MTFFRREAVFLGETCPASFFFSDQNQVLAMSAAAAWLHCEHREADGDGRQKTIFRLQRILPLPPFVDDCFASLIVFEFLMR